MPLPRTIARFTIAEPEDVAAYIVTDHGRGDYRVRMVPTNGGDPQDLARYTIAAEAMVDALEYSGWLVGVLEYAAAGV